MKCLNHMLYLKRLLVVCSNYIVPTIGNVTLCTQNYCTEMFKCELYSNAAPPIRHCAAGV